MEILKEIEKRNSPREFSEKEVEREKVDLLLEAARRAPSSMNNQPWKYIFVSKNDDTRRNLEDSLWEGNSWAKAAPYLVAIFASEEDDKSFIYDTGLSAMSLVLEAEHQGLKCHQMGGFDQGKVKLSLGIPDKYDVMAIMAIGYPREDFELKLKEKKSIQEISYFGKFE